MPTITPIEYTVSITFIDTQRFYNLIIIRDKDQKVVYNNNISKTFIQSIATAQKLITYYYLYKYIKPTNYKSMK